MVRKLLRAWFHDRGNDDDDQRGISFRVEAHEETSSEEERLPLRQRQLEKRSSYTETTPSEVEDEDKEHHRSSGSRFRCSPPYKKSRRGSLVLFSLLLLALMFVTNVHRWNHVASCWMSSCTPPLPVHHEVIPTLLSVVDPDTYALVYALDNPLYLQLQHAKFETSLMKENDDIQELPQLYLDRAVLKHVREPLLLSWTMGTYRDGDPVVRDDDVIVLDCGTAAEIEDEAKALYKFQQFRDAATVAQARATSLYHGNNSSADQNEWYFSRFHVLRDEACQFRLYREQPPPSTTEDPRSNLRRAPWWRRPSSTAEATTQDKNVVAVYSLLAESPVLFLEIVTSPTAIHLALGSSHDEMVVSFVTGGQGTPVALYGTSEDQMTKVSGTSDTYAATDMCEAPANVTEPGKFVSPGQLHTIRLSELKDNTTYMYRCGLAHGQGITWSDTYRFTSAPRVGDPEPFSYIAYGDQGCPKAGWASGAAYTTEWTRREVEKSHRPVRMVHHFGDLSYAQGAAHQWDEWFDMIQNFTTRVPLMVGVGNHEYDHTEGGIGKDPSGVGTPDGFRPIWGNFHNDSGGECGVPTAKRFTMPASESSNGVFWYSFDYASVHTTVISSEHDLSPGSQQHKWLQNDLQAVNRTLTPWLVVESHRPLYEAEASWPNNAVGIAMRYEMEDLLKDYKVDLVLAGHYHAYHRSCAGLYRSQCDNGGPTHITVGSAGAHLDELPLFETTWTDHFIGGEFGYGRITVMNASALHFEFVKAGDKDDTSAGEVHDDVWIWH